MPTSPSTPAGCTPPLAGREREWSALLRAWSDAERGERSAILITGDSGIGKSRLAEELAGAVNQSGGLPLWGRCYEDEGAPAYWPWLQIIRSAAANPDILPVVEQVRGAVPELARLVPEWRLESPAQAHGEEPGSARFQLLEGVLTLLHAAAQRRPLLVLLDDLHWADPPSLQLLQFVLRDRRAARLLILGTTRDASSEGRQAVAGTLGEIALASGTLCMDLTGIDEQGARDLVRFIVTRDLPPAVISELRRVTDGNPLYLGQVVRLLATEGRLDRSAGSMIAGRWLPDGVRNVISRRLDRLSRAAVRVLTYGAVLGREFELAILQQIEDLRGCPLLLALEEAGSARITVQVPGHIGRWSFVHALMREALYEALGPVARAQMHAQLARAIEQRHHVTIDAHLAELAFHFVHAAPIGLAEEGFAYAIRAAQQAMHSLAFEDAQRYYELALEAIVFVTTVRPEQHFDVLNALAEAQYRSGDTDASTHTRFRAVVLARELGAAERLALAALPYGESVPPLGQVDATQVELLEEALQSATHLDRSLRVRVLAALSLALLWSGRDEQRRNTAQEAVALARTIGDVRTLGRALNALWWANFGPDDLRDQLAITDEIVALAEHAGDTELASLGRRSRVIGLLDSGEITAANREIAALAREAAALRQPLYQWRTTLRQAALLLLSGDTTAAQPTIARALELGHQGGEVNAEPLYLVQLLQLHDDAGSLGELLPLLEDQTRRSPYLPFWRCALAFLHGQIGQTEAGREALVRLTVNRCALLPRDRLLLPSLVMLSRLATQLQAREGSRTLYELLLAYNGRIVWFYAAANCFGTVAHYLGMLAGVLGSRDSAIAHFENALRLHEQLGARLWLGRTRCALARVLLEHPGRTEIARARELLDAAGATAGKLAAKALHLEVDALLGHPLLSPRAARGEPLPAGLTRREAEVLYVLTQGKSNREISALFVLSERTVERHIANIYAKIGISGRSARARAAAFAIHHGLADSDYATTT